MERVFLKLVQMGLSAGWLVLAVLVLRWLLRKAPRWILCLLWALVAVRLVCPLSIESRFSLVPRAEMVAQSVREMPGVALPAERAAQPDSAAAPAQPGATPLFVLSRVWLAGAAAMLLWALWSAARLRRRVRTSIPQTDHIRICDGIDTPFVLGLFRPQIYLPSGLEAAQADYVLAHENAHIARRDHWWKPLGWLLLSVYWFHPLLWLAYVLLCRDLELACDERVAKGLDRAGLAAYSEALLRCSRVRRGALVSPVAFGEVGIRSRVKAILRYQKPALRLVSLALAAVLAAGVLFLTDRPANALQPPEKTIGGEAAYSLPDAQTQKQELLEAARREREANPPQPTPTPEPTPDAAVVEPAQASYSQASVQSAAEEDLIIQPPEIHREMPPMPTQAQRVTPTATPPGPTSALPSGNINPTGPQATNPNPQIGVIQYGDTVAIKLY